MADEDVPAKGNIGGKLIPARYILAVLASIGMAIIYGLKVNVSVTIVCMVNHTAAAIINPSTADNSTIKKECGQTADEQKLEDGEFEWDEITRGYILSSYFFGYLVSQIPGGRLAEIYSAKWVYFFSVITNIICTLLTPAFVRLHVNGMIVMRVLEGISGGVSFPSIHVLVAAWAPPNERSIMSTIIYTGTALGNVISTSLSGVLCAYLGWESVFYVMGAVATPWLIAWIIIAQDSPNKQRFISLEEREFITMQISGGKVVGHKKGRVPWKAIATSLPFWAILVAHFCNSFGWYMFLTELPAYLKQILKVTISENSIISAVPYFTLWLFSIILSRTLDSLRMKGKLRTVMARRIATIIGSVGPLICLLILCFIGCNRPVAITLLILGVTFAGAHFCGFLANHIDIAPNYAGTLIGVTNTIATMTGIVVPIFISRATETNKTMTSWRTIFYVTIAMYAAEFIFYTLFSSGEEQWWNKPDEAGRVETAE